MTLLKKSLYDMREDIEGAIEGKLEAFKADEERSEVNSIIYFDDIRIKNISTPAIWWLPDTYTPTMVGGNTEQHNMPYTFISMIKESEPQVGKVKARRLVSDVYDWFMSDRTLDGQVHMIMPGSVDPAFAGAESQRLYWSSIQLEYRVRRIIG